MGEFNVNKSDGSLEQTAGMPSEYPATQVMLSDGVTSVQDRIGNILFVEKSISDVSVSTAWGSLFMGSDVVSITDLGLSHAPDVISVTFSTTAQPVALCIVAGVTKNIIPVSLVRATSGTVSGKIMIMLKSNG